MIARHDGSEKPQTSNTYSLRKQERLHFLAEVANHQGLIHGAGRDTNPPVQIQVLPLDFLVVDQSGKLPFQTCSLPIGDERSTSKAVQSYALPGGVEPKIRTSPSYTR